MFRKLREKKYREKSRYITAKVRDLDKCAYDDIYLQISESFKGVDDRYFIGNRGTIYDTENGKIVNGYWNFEHKVFVRLLNKNGLYIEYNKYILKVKCFENKNLSSYLHKY